MKVTVVPIVVSELERVPPRQKKKRLMELEIRGRIVIIESIELILQKIKNKKK